MDNILKKILSILFVIFSLSSFTQEVIEEKIQIDTTFITYQVIHKETLGEGYFNLKRYVFANDTSIIAIEKNFSNGRQNGLTRIYYPSGKLMVKAIYGNDKLQGEWTHYDELGVIITKGVYNFGLKHGFWAYKSIGTYGRYVKGKKHRNWVKKDKNGKKHKAWYWNGELKKGDDIFQDDYIVYTDTAYVISNTSQGVGDSLVASNFINADIKYINAAKYLVGNYYFRKVTKDYFRPSKKLRGEFINEYVDLDKDVFKLKVSPNVVSVDLFYFLNKEKLIKPTLDSLIKVGGDSINIELKNNESIINEDLSKLTTNENSNMTLQFSKIVGNLVVVELVEELSQELVEKFKGNVQKTSRMLILLYFDEKNEVIEVEYQSKD